MEQMTIWEIMGRYNLPVPGSLIKFTRIPGASYASTGVVYQTGWFRNNYRQVYITRMEGDQPRGGTFDSWDAWTDAEWEYVYTDGSHLEWPRAGHHWVIKLEEDWD